MVAGEASDAQTARHGISVVPGTSALEVCEILGASSTPSVVLVAPVALHETASLAATLAAHTWPDLEVALRVVPQGPLAIYAALAAARATNLGDALALAVFDRLLEQSWSAGLVRSVAALEEPAPSLAQHARSFVPGGQFLVRHHPRPAVTTLKALRAFPSAGTPTTLLVEEGDVAAAVVDTLYAASGATSVQRMSLPGDWTPVYGRPALQFAVIPSDSGAARLSVHAECPTCRRLLAGPACPFCRAVAVGSASLTGGRS